MDDQPTSETAWIPTQAEQDLAASLRIAAGQAARAREYVRAVLEDERNRAQVQAALARRYLASEPPQLSEAATACHRAYQFMLRANALEPLLELLESGQ